MITLDDSYARDLPGTYVPWKPVPVAAARMLFFNRDLALALGLDADALAGATGTEILAGNVVPDGARPIAQAYAGHQFGGFSAQLGDGRAVLLGEVVDPEGRRHDIALKGSGRTPFSRGGDGRAAVGPMLREALISEAMHALGVPTTRALAVVATGEPVYRERALPGAVLTRVAASHLRVGTFQFFAARGDYDRLRQLADYAIERHYPALRTRPQRHLDLLAAVSRRQAALVAQWMNIGFIHGVMNTDNMALSGETIDYGPCAFLEAYDPGTVFSSIDERGRYAYGNQPGIARWNLARFAEALLPLIAGTTDEAAIQRAAEQARSIIDTFPDWYAAALRAGQRAKLGLDDPAGVNRQNFAVHPARFFHTINRCHAFHQPRRLGHMPRPTWMHHQTGIREQLHHRPGATGMIEMNVRQHHVIDGINRHAKLVQRPQGIGNGIIAAGINDSDPPLFENQMDRRMLRPDIVRIDRINIVLVTGEHT